MTTLCRPPGPSQAQGARTLQHAFATPSHRLPARARAATGSLAYPPTEAGFVQRFLSHIDAAEYPVAADLTASRNSSRAALRSTRLPTSREESYRFLDLSFLARASLAPPRPLTAEAITSLVSQAPLARPPHACVVLCNGQVLTVPPHDPGAALAVAQAPTAQQPGVYVGSLSSAPERVREAVRALGEPGEPAGVFEKLSEACAANCLVVHVQAGVKVEQTIQVLHLFLTPEAGGTACSAGRVVVILEEGAEAVLVEEAWGMDGSAASEEESHLSSLPSPPALPSPSALPTPAYVSTSSTRMELDDGASLRHLLLGLDPSRGSSWRSTRVEAGAGAKYAVCEARLGGGLSRHDLRVDCRGEGADVDVAALQLASLAAQQHDLHAHVALHARDCRVRQVHKAIGAAPGSRCVYDGAVTVARLAQRTDANQLSRALLLAPRAAVFVRPNLRIVADDVRCTHGAAVSDLDRQQLFYLASRGIDAAVARRMLVFSFGSEVLARMGDGVLRRRVDTALRQALSRAVADLGAAEAESSE